METPRGLVFFSSSFFLFSLKLVYYAKKLTRYKGTITGRYVAENLQLQSIPGFPPLKPSDPAHANVPGNQGEKSHRYYG